MKLLFVTLVFLPNFSFGLGSVAPSAELEYASIPKCDVLPWRMLQLSNEISDLQGKEDPESIALEQAASRELFMLMSIEAQCHSGFIDGTLSQLSN